MSDGEARIRIGMVGGGPGAGIGETHRIAMRMDNRYDLQAGVFSRDPERSRAFGRSLGISEDRLYPDFAAMVESGAQRLDGVEVVAITTQRIVTTTSPKRFSRTVSR